MTDQKQVEKLIAAVADWRSKERAGQLVRQAEAIARAKGRLLFAEAWATVKPSKEFPQGRSALLRTVAGPNPAILADRLYFARLGDVPGWFEVAWWAQELCSDCEEEYDWATSLFDEDDDAALYVLNSPESAAKMLAECRYRLHGAVSGLLSLHGINSFGDAGPKFLREWEEIWPESKALWPESEAPE